MSQAGEACSAGRGSHAEWHSNMMLKDRALGSTGYQFRVDGGTV